jgi:hypothetical protein
VALLIRFDDVLWESLLLVMRYVKHGTGVEPDQEELAQTLGAYFICNEIGNQLKYLRKRRAEAEDKPPADLWRPRWNFDLISGPPRNNLARVGLFIAEVGKAIEQIRLHAQNAIGTEISDQDIAQALRSSFILSEVVNQVKWLRQSAAEGEADGRQGKELIR